MPYTRLDDAFYDHPETQLRTLAGVGLMAKALAYCGRQLTDGFIPGETMRQLARGRGAKQALDELQRPTTVGPAWLSSDGGGFRIERYFDLGAPWGRQRSRAQIERSRSLAASRKEDYEQRQAQQQLGWTANGAPAGVKA